MHKERIQSTATDKISIGSFSKPYSNAISLHTNLNSLMFVGPGRNTDV